MDVILDEAKIEVELVDDVGIRIVKMGNEAVDAVLDGRKVAKGVDERGTLAKGLIGHDFEDYLSRII